MDTDNSRKRRLHSAELKAQIVAECDAPAQIIGPGTQRNSGSDRAA